MNQTINERFIQFAGSKAGGSQRLPVSFDIEIGEERVARKHCGNANATV